MLSAEGQPVLKYDNLMVSPRGIAETDGNKIIIFVAANEIERITLKFGRPEHRPGLSLSIGSILALIGVFGLVEIFRATRGWRYEIGMMLLGSMGGLLIFDTFKQRYFLEINTKNDLRRLVFSKTAQKVAIENFCKDVSVAHNYKIADSTLG